MACCALSRRGSEGRVPLAPGVAPPPPPPAANAALGRTKANASRTRTGAFIQPSVSGPLLFSLGFVRSDRALELGVFAAGQQADLVQRRELLLRLRHVADHQVGL